MEVIISAWFFGYLLMWCVLLLFICIEVEGRYCIRRQSPHKSQQSRKFIMIEGPHENHFIKGASKVNTQFLSLS